MEYPHCVQNVVLTGRSLTLSSFVDVARFGAKVTISDEAMRAIAEENFSGSQHLSIRNDSDHHGERDVK